MLKTIRSSLLTIICLISSLFSYSVLDREGITLWIRVTYSEEANFVLIK